MDEFRVIGVISETLKELLTQNIGKSYLSFTIDDITLKSPKDMEDSHRLSLYLYHIVENPYMKNQPMERVNNNRLKYSPLSLNLYYLLTPNPKVKINDKDIATVEIQQILGRAMQVLYDHSILEGPDLKTLLEPPVQDYVDFYDKIGQVRIILNSLSLDDLTKIWGALDTPLMLSAFYEVRVIMIESEREKEFTRIEEKSTDYFQIKGNGEES